MTCKSLLRYIKLSAMAVLFLSVEKAAAANFRYTYTGGNYVFFTGHGCYTASEHIRLTMILNHKLPPNLQYNIHSTSNVTPVSWVANDGIHNFSSKNTLPNLFTYWNFATDSTGKITMYEFDVSYGNNNNIYHQVTSASFGNPYQDSATSAPCKRIGQTTAEALEGAWLQP